jgi:hypothetical protein
MWAQELKVEKIRKAARMAVLKATARNKAKVAAVRRPRAQAKTMFSPMAVRNKPKAVAKGKVIKAARTLRRLPESDRKGFQLLFLSIKGSICKPVPADETLEEALERSLRPVPVVMAASLPDPLPHRRVSVVKGAPRRVYLRRGVELRKYGLTESCFGCLSARAGTTPAQTHSEQCRIRIVEAMQRDRDYKVRVEERDRERQKMTEVENDEEGVRSDVLPFAHI